ncbi:MAG: PhnD/SsuA/transferrin family substrate-binding protein [Proteobacteria bacterium]|nr:PhnD/SsuA/transferrin family substrate-binding protein [Pseudomonadota bacterium]
MAEVHLASDRGSHGFERLVVIKRILPHLAERPDFIRMFLQEARVQARVNHPNVVQIFELDEAEGLPFIAMEYVDGSTLRDLVRGADAADLPIPIGVAVNLVSQACAGSHAVHEAMDSSGRRLGLVHRDLTPHNLMVTAGGHVKLLDFGIVKASEQGERTRTGVLKGKLSYMSPEQCHQEDLDRRSDIFTLGTVLWELLAGEKLFSAKTELGTLQAIVTGKRRSLAEVRPDVPEALVAVIDRALAAKRDDRFETAAAMQRAILDAARVSDVLIDQDQTARFIATVLGEHHKARQSAVGVALERSASGATDATNATTLTRGGSVATTSAVGMMGAAAVTGVILTLVGVLVILLLVQIYRTAPVVDTYVSPTEGEEITLVFPEVLDKEAYAAELEPLRRYLETALNRPVAMPIVESYHQAAMHLGTGSAQYASLPPNLYVQTKRKHPDLELLAMKVFDHSTGHDSVLLVPGESKAKGLEDLVGGRFCYPDPASTSGFVLPTYRMRQAGLDPETDFVLFESGNHHQVLRDLIDGKCELAATYSGAVRTADEIGVTVSTARTLMITGRTPHDAIVSLGADPEEAEAVRAALLAFSPQDAVGADRLGDLERITGFSAMEDDAYDDLRAVIDDAPE